MRHDHNKSFESDSVMHSSKFDSEKSKKDSNESDNEEEKNVLLPIIEEKD